MRLYADLLTNYNPLERPVADSKDPIVVKMRLFLQQIVDVDEKNQVVQINAWLRFVRLTIFVLFSSADENFDSTFKSNLLVYSSGEVNWIPPGILKFSCRIDITWFPFDDQICGLKFGSWTFHGFALDLQIDSSDLNATHQMDLSEYVINGEWDLLASPASRSVTYYSCCPEPYPTLLFSMHIRRRTLYYGFNLIIPSLLISLMTALGFTLPPDAGEKITLEITILLSVCFFLSMVAEMTPPTSEAVPLIGVFFSCCMMVVSTSVVFTVLILNLHFRTPETHVMSPLVRRILLNWLPWLMMMTRPGTIYSHGQAITVEVSSERKRELEPIDAVDDNTFTSEPAADAQILLLHRVYMELKEITRRMEEEEESERLQNDWKFAAMVVDRACLICFSVFITLSTCSIILSAPHLTA
ncbi:Acetylcholine receptor subunit alpha-type acr-16 [Toxocara canis]|uniref:Acetylcholine receptor subunit alpha-type acr-16 n=1 Tax=Toxocara canis TaxID=6265 RepID=A0A0B2VAZ0_TOXCA|nr:Acetylcholine receptor subunit alpha-type acr-16 [Toxocara canis]